MKRSGMLIGFSILVLTLFFANAPANCQPRLALVIGNSDYAVGPLKNPVNDASDMAQVLRQCGFEVTLKTNADLRTMETSIRKFGKQLRAGGTGLFYYAGHGISVNNRNYLIPTKAVLESQGDVKYEAVDAGLVLAKMEDAGNSLNIVILDACRNNPFARSFRAAAAGLARMDAPTGSIIAYATAPGSVAADGEGRNGIYTQYLLENMAKPGMSIERVLKNVRRSVLSRTERRQTPWESSSLTGDFYFIPGRTGQASATGPALPAPSGAQAPGEQPQPQGTYVAAIEPARPAARSSIEDIYYNQAKADLPMARKYLALYPDGRYAGQLKNTTFKLMEKMTATGASGGNTTTYTYDSQGRMTLLTMKDKNYSFTTAYTYDALGNAVKEVGTHRMAGNTTVTEEIHEYDSRRRKIRTTMTTRTTGYTNTNVTTYEYNGLDLLTRQVTGPNEHLYDYDNQGNKVHCRVNLDNNAWMEMNWQFDAENQMTELETESSYFPGKKNRYQYTRDAGGYTTKCLYIDMNGKPTEYHYNYRPFTM